MNLTIDRRAGRVLVRCEGSLDAATAPQFEDALLAAIQDGHGNRLTLDLYGVRYVASAGLRVLVLAARRLGESGGTLRLVNVQPTVQRIIETTGLHLILSGHSSRPPTPARKPPVPANTLAGKVVGIRNLFPAPTSDPVHDAYFVFSLLRGVDRIDAMKSGKAFLGKRRELDYDRARAFRVPDAMTPLETVVRDTADYLEGHVLPGHPLTQENVVPPPTIASIAGNLLASIHNPNTIWDAYCHRVAEAEIEAVAGTAGLVGYDPDKAGGVFTFGGTGTTLYGLRLAIEKAVPDAMRKGVREDLKVIAADVAHYAKLNVLGWTGIGTDNLVTVPTDEDNSMRLVELESAARGVLDSGAKLAAIICTAGTTDAFGIDNIEFAAGLRDRLVEEYRLPYRPHIHADAVIGWAFAVFNDYDFDANPLGFNARTLRSLWDTRDGVRHLRLADSVGVDFHKTGYTPYTSSLFLCQDRDELKLLSRSPELMPYLFQFGNYHPGEYTLETSRSGGGMLAALANLKCLGKEGYRILLGHTVAMAEHLRRKLEETESTAVLNDYNYGPVTLFRVYPPGVDAHRTYLEEMSDPSKRDQLRAHNDYNRRIFKRMMARMEAGEGPALSQTDHYRDSRYGEPILAIKSFVMSPFVDEAAMDMVIAGAAAAQKAEAGA